MPSLSPSTCTIQHQGCWVCPYTDSRQWRQQQANASPPAWCMAYPLQPSKHPLPARKARQASAAMGPATNCALPAPVRLSSSSSCVRSTSAAAAFMAFCVAFSCCSRSELRASSSGAARRAAAPGCCCRCGCRAPAANATAAACCRRAAAGPAER